MGHEKNCHSWQNKSGIFQNRWDKTLHVFGLPRNPSVAASVDHRRYTLPTYQLPPSGDSDVWRRAPKIQLFWLVEADPGGVQWRKSPLVISAVWWRSVPMICWVFHLCACVYVSVCGLEIPKGQRRKKQKSKRNCCHLFIQKYFMTRSVFTSKPIFFFTSELMRPHL